MRIGVIHDSLRVAGGGERVCLKTVEAIKQAGHDVYLGTVEPTDWHRLDRLMAGCQRPDLEFSLLNLSETPVRIYMGMLTPLVYAAISPSCDLCIQSNGDVMPVADILYMHYLPTSVYNDGTLSQGSTLLRRLYSGPYRGLYKKLIGRHKVKNILANSKFTQETIMEQLGAKATVVYPPVEVNKFLSVRGQTRNKTVITCGRYSPEKNYEFVLRVASLTPDCEFVIIGTFSGSTSRKYYEKLMEMADSLKLHNIRLIRNEKFENLLSHLGNSRILLSAKVNEPFGLSVVEGMAAGLVPLVHRSGGPWVDSLAQKDGPYGYSYLDADGASRVITNLLNDDHRCDEISMRNLERVEMFSDVKFKLGIVRAVENPGKANT
jgi:alpha-1,2-mannosyltransferase